MLKGSVIMGTLEDLRQHFRIVEHHAGPGRFGQRAAVEERSSDWAAQPAWEEHLLIAEAIRARDPGTAV
jgi:DNA-binding GntR family transcriptional regulator